MLPCRLTSAVPKMRPTLNPDDPPEWYFEPGEMPEQVDWEGQRVQIDLAKKYGLQQVGRPGQQFPPSGQAGAHVCVCVHARVRCGAGAGAGAGGGVYWLPPAREASSAAWQPRFLRLLAMPGLSPPKHLPTCLLPPRH